LVARSNGDGSFTTVYAVVDDGAAGLNGIAGYDLLSEADQVLAFDYDKDGDDDLIFYRLGTDNFFVARSNGDGTFSADNTELINSLTEALALEQAKLGQLKQQYQLEALEVLAVNQDRLESLKGQLAAETSFGGAVKETTIGGYVVLVSQFAEQLTGLSDIWAESLKENHQFTVEVSNLFDSNLTAFVGIKKFIEDNLAVPYSDYVLNSIQLDEALAIQETQVKYRDALAKTVDDLQENIELQKKSVEQTDLLSAQLMHIVTLRNLEEQYTTSFNKSSDSLIIDILGKEITNKIQDLPNQIELLNDQQEQWIETSLQKYIQQKHKTILSSLTQIYQTKPTIKPITINEPIYSVPVSSLQNLRLEIAHLTLQSEINPDKVQQFLQDSLNIFNIRDTRLTPSVSNNNFNYRTGDFNGDGKTDLIHLVDSGNGYVHVWLSKGDGTFDVKSAFTPSSGYSVSNNNFNYRTGDFNGDGKTDLIH
jgi:hypothetical protein